MKSVLISIQPKWIEKIASGEKTVEVRKSCPKLETPFKCYIYCTNGTQLVDVRKEKIYLDVNNPFLLTNGKSNKVTCSTPPQVNRKVIGEFVCDEITQFGNNFFLPSMLWIEKEACLSGEDICNYLGKKESGFAWHISDLKIYEKPKELSEFYSAKWDMLCEHKKRGFNMDFCMAYENGSHFCKELICDKKRLIRPPQSWCYIEVGE